MTQQYGDHTTPESQRSTAEVARNEAAGVARTAADRSGEVAGSVGEQANRVASETGRQARNLLDEGKEQLSGQARQGQQRAADGLRTVANQLQQMSDKSDDKGVASEVARQVADRTNSVASWLENREPGDLLDEVRQFARRKPGVFLLGAALAGVAVGRLTRGAIAAQSDDSSTDDARSGATQGQFTDRTAAPQPSRHVAPPPYPPQQADVPGYSPQQTNVPGYPPQQTGVPGYPAAPAPPGSAPWDPSVGPVNR